jgi:SagB-type dehydrogenase family enzyme
MPRSSVGRLRRSPYIVCYWHDSQLIYENCLTRVRITASPICTAILSFFDDWRGPHEIRAQFPHFSGVSVDRTLETLRTTTFLDEEGRSSATEAGFETWRAWFPAAPFFHFGTKDVAYRIKFDGTREQMRKWIRDHPQPPFFKQYSGARTVKLSSDRCVPKGEFRSVLFNRRTWRMFSRQALSLDDLAFLLNLTWGVREYADDDLLGRLPLKSSPSAGARHPTEAYVAALRVDGLRPGLYHYASNRYVLECLQERRMKQRVIRYLGGQWWYGEAAAVVLMTAVFPRVVWKYKYARAYRSVLLDAGHLCQTFCLAATWLNLAPFCTAALADSIIEKDLGIDGITESVIYAAGVGCRPPAEFLPARKVRGGASEHPAYG